VFRATSHGYALVYAFTNASSGGAHPNTGLIVD
jgi:hypothetical protein